MQALFFIFLDFFSEVVYNVEKTAYLRGFSSPGDLKKVTFPGDFSALGPKNRKKYFPCI